MTTTATTARQRPLRPEKESIGEEIRRRVESAAYLILVDFTGLDSAKTTDLRNRLRQAGARMQVVPNRMFREAVGAPAERLAPALRGPTAVILGGGDITEVARALAQYQKETKLPTVKLAEVGGQVMTATDLAAIAALPGKAELRGMLVGVLAAPLRGLVTVLHQLPAGLVRVLKAIEEKKGSAVPA